WHVATFYPFFFSQLLEHDFSFLSDHPGVCPPPTYTGNPYIICPAVIFPSCSHDSQCGKHEKCCDNGCARVCTAATKRKMEINSHF
uniref:WAP domain-containing protein n=1 Tax=Salarias fasciatus TaxID=181472 RepID=A0A672IRH2_SALFA